MRASWRGLYILTDWKAVSNDVGRCLRRISHAFRERGPSVRYAHLTRFRLLLIILKEIDKMADVLDLLYADNSSATNNEFTSFKSGSKFRSEEHTSELQSRGHIV